MKRWVKLYTVEWIDGSIRTDLTPAERSVWSDLLAMAGMSRREGHIERSQGIPFTDEALASRFVVPVDLLQSCIQKSQAEGRLTVNGDGTMYITNWLRYQTVPEGKSAEDKRAYRQQAKAKAKDKQTSLDALRREVNRLNMNITAVGKKLRYVERDGEILDTETGEIVPLGKDGA